MKNFQSISKIAKYTLTSLYMKLHLHRQLIKLLFYADERWIRGYLVSTVNKVSDVPK